MGGGGAFSSATLYNTDYMDLPGIESMSPRRLSHFEFRSVYDLHCPIYDVPEHHGFIAWKACMCRDFLLQVL
jgi:hypothetical protein